MLDNMDPKQKQILMYGAPVVAAFALITTLKKKNAPAAPPLPTSGGTAPTTLPSTDAIGVGQLSDFESLVTNQLQAGFNGLQQQVKTLTPVVQQTPAPAPAAPAGPASLPRVRSGAYPISAVTGEGFDVLGTFSGGGMFTGQNIEGGVPVYAFTGGQWQQNFDAKKLPAGTALGAPSSFRAYEVPGTVTEQL